MEGDMKRAARMDIDRLSDLPEALKIRILGCLHAKQAVQTSILSKTWVSLWTWIPVLELSYFDLGVDNVSAFDKFVNNVLCRRDRLATLDRLKFIHPRVWSTVEILKSVFDYAFSHGVKQLEASIQSVVYRDDSISSWPVSLCDSLTSLKLLSDQMTCPFLGPGSTSFKNLAILYLKGALITDVDPFSAFPVLKSLTLLNCKFQNQSKTMRIDGLLLSDLTILWCTSWINCELRTPSLRMLKYSGDFFITDHGGLPVLETLDIDSYSFSISEEKRLFDRLLHTLTILRSVKSVTLSSAIIHILFLFPDELVRGCSPFWGLKDLKLDLRDHYCLHPSRYQNPSRDSFKSVKAYLLQNSPDAKFTVTKPKSLECKVLSICYEYRNL